MTRRALWFPLALLIAAVSAVWLAGCGGAGGPTWSSSGPSYNTGSGYGPSPTDGAGGRAVPQATGVVRGVVEAPARPGGFQRPVASWLRIGAPAHAEAQTVRRPLSGATVSLIDRATRKPVSQSVTANDRGEFRIERITASDRFSVSATDGKITLEAVVPTLEPGREETQIAVNEATTVGAEAARLVEEEGFGPEAALSVARAVAELQEKHQAEHPAELPDLTRTADSVERARKHLLRTADAAVAAALDSKDKDDAWHALASVQVLARTRLKLSRKVRLTPQQGEALAGALVSKENRAAPAEKIAAALKKAGVNSKAATPDAVWAALEGLHKTVASLKDLKRDQVPVLAALILVERGDGAFRVTTREQMKAFLKELVGEADAPEAKPKVAAKR